MSALSRNVGLDIVRSIAILCVLILHINVNILTKIPLNLEIGVFTCFIGGFGVHLFFVLSGFLIGQIIINSFILKKEKTFLTLINFYLRRWFRTLPLYYLFLIINFLRRVFLNNLGVHNLWSYIFFLQTFFAGRSASQSLSFMPESWSLCVEELFYLTFPIFIIIYKKINKNFNHRHLMLLCIALIFFSTLCGFIRFLFYPEIHTDTIIFNYGMIASGILLSCIYKFYPNLYKFLSRKIFFILAVITILLCNFWIIYLGKIKGFAPTYYIGEFMKDDLFSNSLLGLIIESCAMLIICFLSELKIASSKIFTFISKISYSAYLVNLPLIYTIFYLFKFEPVVMLFLTYFLIALVSFLLYKYYEYPIMKLRELFGK